MFTIEYKGWYIHGYIDKPECTVCLPNGVTWERVKSLQSAKRSITKAVKWVKVKP